VTTIRIVQTFKVDGVLTDVTSAKLSDADALFGVKRNDTDAIVVADDTAMTNVSTGVYKYEFTAPAAGLTYTGSLEFVYSGETTYKLFTVDHTAVLTRTQEDEVRAIGGFKEGISLLPFIQVASRLVDRVSDCAGSDLDEASLGDIEMWLAAHYASLTNPLIMSKSIAGASSSFQRGQVTDGLKATVFGQQALALDSSGCLEKLTANQRPGLLWGGTEAALELDYEAER